jgi:hypothetical protein
MDTLYILMGSFFTVLFIIIVLGAIKNCKDIIQIEREMKAEAKMKKLTSHIFIPINEDFLEDPI